MSKQQQKPIVSFERHGSGVAHSDEQQAPGGHSHDGKPCGGHGGGGANGAGKSGSHGGHASAAGASHSHSHDGKPCGGHGGGGVASASHGGNATGGHSHGGHGGHSSHSHGHQQPASGHSHDGKPCGGHGGHGSAHGHNGEDEVYNRQVEAHIKWIVQDYKSALSVLDPAANPEAKHTARHQSRLMAAAISELLRMGPRPESVVLPDDHPFLVDSETTTPGPIGVFVQEGVMQTLIRCCLASANACVDCIKTPGSKSTNEYDFDTLIYLECILDLLYTLYDGFEDDKEQEETLPETSLLSKNAVVLDQFLQDGEGIQLVRCEALAHILPPLVPDIGELRVAIITLLKSFQVYLCGCDGVSCGKVEEKQGEFKSCAKCRHDVYCSRECQVAAWVSHKLVCGKVLRPIPSSTSASPDVLMAAASAVQAAKSASAKQHHAM